MPYVPSSIGEMSQSTKKLGIQQKSIGLSNA